MLEVRCLTLHDELQNNTQATAVKASRNFFDAVTQFLHALLFLLTHRAKFDSSMFSCLFQKRRPTANFTNTPAQGEIVWRIRQCFQCMGVRKQERALFRFKDFQSRRGPFGRNATALNTTHGRKSHCGSSSPCRRNGGTDTKSVTERNRCADYVVFMHAQFPCRFFSLLQCLLVGMRRSRVATCMRQVFIFSRISFVRKILQSSIVNQIYQKIGIQTGRRKICFGQKTRFG
jgi:hypothetical protein